MRPKSEVWQDVHAQALREFDDIQSALWAERTQCREDRRFATIAGAQYEGNWGEMFENRPRPEVNKIQAALVRLLNEYRSNRMQASFIRKDGVDEDETAELCAGLFRADEEASGAQEAYDNGFDEAASGGIGAWRLRNCYESDDGSTDYQRIRIEPIYDADMSVWFDLQSKRQDKSDAGHAFVLYTVSPKVAKDEYGLDVTDWPTVKLAYGCDFDWYRPDVVYLAEYYKVEKRKDTLYTYTMLDGEEVKVKDGELDDELRSRYELLRDKTVDVVERKIKTRRVHKWIMSGDRILEDRGYIAGGQIPIVPVYGKRWFIDGVERCAGEVRYAKDAQRLLNMQVSVLCETAATSPQEVPIFSPQQVAGHELSWSRAAVDKPAYMLVNPLFDADGNQMPGGPVAYTKPPQLSPSMAALLQLSQSDLREILGDGSGMEKMVSNTSAEAIQLTQTRVDAKSFIYMDNMAKAVRRSAEIWLAMAREVYSDDARPMKTIDAMEEVGTVDLAEVVEVEGVPKPRYDLANAQYDAQVVIGPASQSRRQKTVQDLISLMAETDSPDTKAVLNAMVMMNLDGEGVSQLRDYFRKQLLMAGAVKPTEDEEKMLQELANQPGKPNPEAEYLMAQAQKAIADAEKAKAEAIATMKEISPEAEQAKAAAEIAKASAEIEKAQIEARQAAEDRAFEREKMQIELEKELIALAAERQRLEAQIQAEAIKGQASIDVASAGADKRVDAVNSQIEALAEKLNQPAAQPIVIQSGGKTFTIERTSKGYKGQIQES